MTKIKIKNGQKFGRLIVIDKDQQYINSSGKKYNAPLCQCECGKMCNVLSFHLLSGHTKSCGCYSKEKARETCIKNHKKDVNDFYVENEITYIILTKNKKCIIDSEDYELVKNYRWVIDAYNHVKSTSGIYIHNLIMHHSNNTYVDHIDRNGLNNKKSNLRICTHQENCFNRSYKTGKSGFRGVRKVPSGNYVASIGYNYKNYYIGTFTSAIEAAHAYDKKAKELFGKFAVLNFD